MPANTDQRPPVAIGHVRLPVADVGAAARWLETVGLRPIVTMEDLAVLELRGGTHVVSVWADGPVRLETSNGSVEVTLPSKFDEEVRAHTSNGSITLRASSACATSRACGTSNATVPPRRLASRGAVTSNPRASARSMSRDV